MNKNLSAADRNLRFRKIPDDLFILIVGIYEFCPLVGKKGFVCGRVISLFDLYSVFKSRVVSLIYIADIPVYPAGSRVIGRSSLADVNIGVSCVINSFIGGDNRRAASESKVYFFAHGIVDHAVFRRDGNTARNAGERFGKLARNVGFVRRNGKIALCRVACTGFKGVFAVGARLKRNGIYGGSCGFCPVSFPNGGYAVVAASVSVAANKVAVCIIVE